jgi:hypothetical protein
MRALKLTQIVLVASFALALGPIGQASAQTVVSPYTGQTVAQPNGGGQTVTNPTGQGVTQAGDGQVLTQPSAAQSINSPAEGTQTVTQPGQCIDQTAAGQDVTQPGQDVPQGVPAGSCATTTVPPTPPCTVNCGPPPHPVCTTGHCGPPQPHPVCTTGHCGPLVCATDCAPPPPVCTVGYGTACETQKLAFTGFDVWKLLLFGALFVAAGAGTWRLARKVGSAPTNR